MTNIVGAGPKLFFLPPILIDVVLLEVNGGRTQESQGVLRNCQLAITQYVIHTISTFFIRIIDIIRFGAVVVHV